MRINRMGINYTHGDNFVINRPSGSGDYLILLIKTPAVFKLHGEEVIADKNSVIIYSMGTSQNYYAHHCRFTNDFIHFEPDSEIELRSLHLDTLLKLPNTKQISKIFKDIYLEYISNSTNREASIDLLLKYLLVKISDLAAYQPQNNIYGYYDTFLSLRSRIYQHPGEKWTISRLSRQVNLSPSHFQRLYKKTFGVTCIADVIACKTEYAKASLAGTGETIREISVLCGYDNEEHFMRQFKRLVGVTPSQYRLRMMNQDVSSNNN